MLSQGGVNIRHPGAYMMDNGTGGSVPQGGGVPRVKTEEKQKAILEAASRVFSTKEFHEVLTDEIAAQARIGKGTIYRYFATKEDLYFATVVANFDHLHEALSRSIAQAPTGRERLERIALEILTFFWRRRNFYALLYRNDRRLAAEGGRVSKDRERIVAVVQKTILEGIENHEFRGVNARTAAEIFLGMIRGANVFRREGDTIEGLTREIMEIFSHGISRETHCV